MSASSRSISAASVARWAVMGLLSAGWLSFLIVTCVIALTLPAVIIAPILGFFTLGYCITAIVLAVGGSRHPFCSAYTEIGLLALHFIGWLALGIYYAIFTHNLSTAVNNFPTSMTPLDQSIYDIYSADTPITAGLAAETFILAFLSLAWIGLLVFRAARVQGMSTAQALKTPAHFLMTGDIAPTTSQEGKEFMMEEPTTEDAAGSSLRIV